MENDTAPNHPTRAPWQRVKDLLPLAMSLLALGLSGATFYRTQLQPARLTVDTAEVAYLAIDANGIFEFHLNVTLSNGGAGMAVARKVAVLLQSPERSDGYLLEAVYIERLNEQTQFVNESEVGPISVEGRQSQSRRIRFISSRDRPNDKPLEKAGAYTATVLVWTADDAGPTAATGFPFTLTSPKAAILAEMRAGTRHNTVDVHHQGFDRWGPRVVSDSEVRELLAGS